MRKQRRPRRVKTPVDSFSALVADIQQFERAHAIAAHAHRVVDVKTPGGAWCVCWIQGRVADGPADLDHGDDPEDMMPTPSTDVTPSPRAEQHLREIVIPALSKLARAIRDPALWSQG